MNRKFKHHTWYKGSNLTVKQFLELAAEDKGFFLKQIPKKEQSNNPFEHLKYKTVIANESGGIYNLSKDEIFYFSERRNFWEQWHNDFLKNNFKGHYNYEYICKENTAKLKVIEYANAYNCILKI